MMQTIWDKYSCIPGRGVCVFDPGTLMLGTMAASAAGTGLQAAGTIAGGNNAAAAGRMTRAADDYAADQIDTNASSEIGASQRTMLDTNLKTKLARSSIVARAAGGGTNAATGSPLATETSVAGRGTYHALMDLFNGENRATGEQNKAKGLRYSGLLAETGGDMAKDASRLAALGTIAGGGASMFKSYGDVTYGKNRWG